MSRLRHVFLDNLFGNINHRERHGISRGSRGEGRRTKDVMLPVLYPGSPVEECSGGRIADYSIRPPRGCEILRVLFKILFSTGTIKFQIDLASAVRLRIIPEGL